MVLVLGVSEQQLAQAHVHACKRWIQPCCMPVVSDGSTHTFVMQPEPFVEFIVRFPRLRLPWLLHCGALAARLRGCERVRTAARPLGAASVVLFSRTGGQNSLESAARTAHPPERSQAGFGK